jgi:protein gp37
MSKIWNPWHGCEKYSEGCAHCYVYRRDDSVGRDASEVRQNRDFDLPVRRRRDGTFVIPSGETVYACMTSDFFLPRADAFRSEAWRMIRARADLRFVIITKRIVRFTDCIAPDWGDGYENVTITCTVESEKQCRIRMPILLQIPALRKQVCCEPLLDRVDLSPYLDERIARVIVGGESGPDARLCRWEWVCDLYRQCAAAGVPFTFKQTGARFEKDGRVFRVPRSRQMEQAGKAAAIYFSGGADDGL